MTGFVLYVGLMVLNRFPHIFNYPTDITPENAESQYRIATKLIRTLNLLIVATFFYIQYSKIQTAMGVKAGLGTWFMPIFLVVVFGTLAIYLFLAMRKTG